MTALGPAAGTPPAPRACTEITPPGPPFTGAAVATPIGPNGEGRVSRMRFGESAVNTSPLEVPYHPTISKITCTLPLLLRTFTLPPLPSAVPTLTITRFGMVTPAAKFRFAALGAPTSDGYTVR